MTALTATSTGDRLPAFALFGAVLSGAGLPIYLYAPKYFADTYGASLTLLGVVLFGLRLFDFVAVEVPAGPLGDEAAIAGQHRRVIFQRRL